MSEQRKRRAQIVKTANQSVGTGNQTDDVIDLVELFYRLLGSWKLITCMALGFAIAAGVFTMFFITPMYEATSTIYVLNRSDSSISMTDLQMGNALTSDYIKVFSMWEVNNEVISNLNLSYSYQQLKSMLSVKNDSGTRMLDITFRSSSPQEAAAVANEYAEVASQYIADTMSTDKPNMVSKAMVPDKPVSPNKKRNVLVAFVLGAMMACGIVTVQMLMDDKYKTAEDIRIYTGLATLAIVPIEDEDETAEKKPKNGRRKQ